MSAAWKVWLCVMAATVMVAGACKTEPDVEPARETAATAAPASPASSTSPAVDSTAASNGASARTGRPTILFVGTSLTAGLGLDAARSYPALIGRRIDSLGLNYQVINAGVSGQTSAGTLRSIEWLMRQPVDAVVLETGANDGLRALSVDSMRANIQAIIDRVRAAHPSARIYIVGMEAPPNMGPQYTAAFRAVYPEIASRNGATFIPFLLDGVAGVDSLNQSDGIHPNERGAEIVAENVWRVLGRDLR
ncbi:MAG TPA: arylesterase [Gemmatimonadaceae bacterium]|nr:arylesterase [Gemmatimonadaceae bacterium]